MFPVFTSKWINELHEMGIKISDSGHESTTIDVLIGSDVAGRLYTGRRHVLSNKLVAVETLLGWTLMGRIPANQTNSCLATSTFSLFVNDLTISNLWGWMFWE